MCDRLDLTNLDPHVGHLEHHDDEHEDPASIRRRGHQVIRLVLRRGALLCVCVYVCVIDVCVGVSAKPRPSLWRVCGCGESVWVLSMCVDDTVITRTQ